MPKNASRLTAILAIACLMPMPQAHAVSKEMIQLQTQVQQLQDMLQHLQQSNDERMGVLQHLVEQTADNVNRMSVTVNTLADAVKNQNDATSAKVDGVSGQVQTLNDSVDELKTRVANLSKQLQDLQAQAQNVNGQPAGGQPVAQQQGVPPPTGAPGDNQAPPPQQQQPPAPQAPPVDQLYQGGLRDYNSARYDVAQSEFSDVLKYYPQEPLAGNAQFYLAEIAYRQGDFKNAIQGYDAVLQQYAGNPKTPAAQLRKGESYLNLNQRDAGVRELRNLIQRYPQTPEAQQARSRLNALGVRITANKPSPYQH